MSHLAHTVAVRASGVDMFFGTPENQVVALKQADFEARRGELIMLVGPSGCGKTTLLSVIAGTLTPQAGAVGRLLKFCANAQRHGLGRRRFCPPSF